MLQSKSADLGFHVCDASWRKDAADQAPQFDLSRRIHGDDHRWGFAAAFERNSAYRRKCLPIVHRRVNVIKARERPKAALLIVISRRLIAQPSVRRIRI